MTNLAALGLRFDTYGAPQALQTLDQVNDKSGKAETATGLLAQAQERAAGTTRLFAGALGLLGVGSVTAAILALRTATLEYSASLAEISTLVDTATFSMNDLSDAAIRQAGEFNSSPLLQTKALYAIISAGATDAATATNILTAANRLAVGGVTTVAIAADGLTSVLNAYGPKAGGAAAVSDALFVAMRSGKTTISELSGALGQVSPLAAQVGVSFDELAAATAALTKGGVSTSVAVTGLRAILAAVAKPSGEASKLAAELGLEFGAAALEAQGLTGFLTQLAEKTGGNTDQLAVLFGGVEALVPVLALAGQAGIDFTAIMEEMRNKLGATDEAFGKVEDGPAFQVERIFSKLGANALSAGNSILNGLAPAIRTVDSILQGTYPHAEALNTIMGLLGAAMGVVAARGAIALTTALTSQVTAVILASATMRAYAASVALVGPVSATATAATSLFGAALRGVTAFLMGPWGIAIGAVIGLYLLLKNGSQDVEAAMRKEAEAAGAGGAMYLELRAAATNAAEAQKSVGSGSDVASGGLKTATERAEELRLGLVALGIEAEYTAVKLAQVGLQQARNAQEGAMSRWQAAENAPRNPNSFLGGAGGQDDLADALLGQVTRSTEELEIATAVTRAATERLEAGLARGRTGAPGAGNGTGGGNGGIMGAETASRPGRSETERAIEESQRFVESLQLETRELGLNAKERRLLAIETAALNAPTREMTQSILEAGTAWEMSMLVLEERDRQAAASDYLKHLTDEAEMLDLEASLIGASNVERAVAISQLETEIRLRRELGENFPESPEGKKIIAQAGDNAVADVSIGQQIEAHNLELRYMLDLWTQIDQQAVSASRNMADALGPVGEAFGGILSAMTGYQSALESIAYAEEKYRKDLGENIDPRRIEMFAQQRSMAEIESYAAMTGAAKSFFKEGSDGWRALHAVETAYRVFQFAAAAQSMIMGKSETATSVLSSATRAGAFMAEGAAKMFAALGPLGFPAVASMVAVLAGLGLRGGGGGRASAPGGGANAPVQSSVQTAQESVRRDQDARDGFIQRLAASVEVRVTADRDGLNAYVADTARRETAPMIAAGTRMAVDASRKIVPSDMAKRQSVTLGSRR